MAKGLAVVTGSSTIVHKFTEDGTAYISGSLTVTGSSFLQEVSGTNAQFTSYTGNGSSITNITASNIDNFTADVRTQFTAGADITIVDGVISAVAGGAGVTYTVEFNAAPSQPTSGQLVYSNTLIRFNILDSIGVDRSHAIFELVGVTPTLDGASVALGKNIAVILEKTNRRAYASATFLTTNTCTISYYTNGTNEIIQIQSSANLNWEGDDLDGATYFKPSTASPEDGLFTIEAYQSSTTTSLPGGPQNSLQFNNSSAFSGSENLIFDPSISVLSLSGTMNITGSIIPQGDGLWAVGSETNRLSDLHAVQVTAGAYFETGLETEGIGKNATGTVVCWHKGKLAPSKKANDNLVMGVIMNGKDEPIIMGAEYILVTGEVKEGDFLVTSSKKGHAMSHRYSASFQERMVGIIIAQALENCNGESNLIKCLINKM